MKRTITEGLERPANGPPSEPRNAPPSIEPPAETASAGPPDLTSLVADLRAALGELKCLGSERLRRHGVSMGHLHAMALLERHGRLSMSHLAELLDVGLSNVTGLVDRMEERGLVERIRVPDDRRLVLVALTDYGRRLLEEMDVLRNDLLTRVLAQLEPESLAAVSVAVSRLRDVVREAVAEARAEVAATSSPPDPGGGQRHHRRT
ncbi:MAG TPA: MarR family transcriptional regulator [Candidatus Binatia bacterium]|nr:MarR family transcriptional regulator [Candidatus Binatia bacterium]